MTRLARFLTLLYAALSVAANPVLADDLSSLRTGDMRKLVIHDEPRPASEARFVDPSGGEAKIADFAGKITVLNFWAVWCAPCKKEMPSLNALQKDMGSDRFEVVVVATGRNNADGIKRFWKEFDIDALETYLDPKSALARDMGVLGLPMTMILDAKGGEIARLQGEADWSSPEAKALLSAIIAQGSGS